MSDRLKIGQEVLIHGYVDEIRKDIIIIRNEGGYFGTVECEITDNEASSTNEVLDKIRAEIESNMESIIGKYGSNTPARDMPSAKIERNSARMEALEIIDKYKGRK